MGMKFNWNHFKPKSTIGERVLTSWKKYWVNLQQEALWISSPKMLWTSRAFVCPSTNPTDQGWTWKMPRSFSEVLNLTSMASRCASSPFSTKDWKCMQYWWLDGKRPTAPYFELSLKSKDQGSKKKFLRDWEGIDCTVTSWPMCFFTQGISNRTRIPLVKIWRVNEKLGIKSLKNSE